MVKRVTGDIDQVITPVMFEVVSSPMDPRSMEPEGNGGHGSEEPCDSDERAPQASGGACQVPEVHGIQHETSSFLFFVRSKTLQKHFT